MALLDGRAFDDGQLLIGMLGSFWSRWFPDQQILHNLMDGFGQMYFDAHILTEEMYNSLSKETVPVYNWRLWGFLELSQGEAFEIDALKFKYGEGRVYGDGISYGQQSTEKATAYPLPLNIRDCTHLYNRVVDPSLVLVKDIDFVIDHKTNLIYFVKPIEDDPLIAKKVDESTGVVTYALWAKNALEDKEYIWKNFGYVLRIWMASSKSYQAFVSALWDVVVLGPAKMAVKTALAALTGIPFAGGDETVVAIETNTRSLTIITDKHVYMFKPNNTPVVAVGQYLYPGDGLVDAITVITPTETTDWGNLPGFSAGPGTLNMRTTNALVFENRDVAINYAQTHGGKTIVEFELQGYNHDIQKFWKEVHRRGVFGGSTLGEYLDTRGNRVGQPTAADLPAVINPFLFIMNNLLMSNTYIIRVRPAQFAEDAPGLSYIGHLTSRLPAHTGMVIFVEMPEKTDYYDTEDLVESLTFRPALTPQYDEIDEMLNDLGPSFRTVPENCR
jgi:hypothetical protein